MPVPKEEMMIRIPVAEGLPDGSGYPAEGLWRRLCGGVVTNSRYYSRIMYRAMRAPKNFYFYGFRRIIAAETADKFHSFPAAYQ
jgi:hypothetical protein